jgi:upstream activation factor subunit UAF30
MAAKKKKAAKKATKKVAKKPAKKAAKKATKPKTKRKPNAAFMKPVTPNEKLAAVVGAAPLPRTELTKKLWVYIKKHNLQDKKNRRMINADAALKVVFGGKSQVSMFDMTKLVSKNLK